MVKFLGFPYFVFVPTIGHGFVIGRMLLIEGWKLQQSLQGSLVFDWV